MAFLLPHSLRWLPVAVLAWMCAPQLVSAQAYRTGDTVAFKDFEEAAGLSGADWYIANSSAVGIATLGQGGVLRIFNGTSDDATATLRLPAVPLRGAHITVRARVRAVEVSRPAVFYHGIKMMLHFKRSGGRDEYPQVAFAERDFGWVQTTLVAEVPEDAIEAELVLGLQQAAGTVLFDDVLVRVGRSAYTRPATPAAGLFTDTALRLRGAMISTLAGLQDLRDLAALGANHVRWQLTWNGFPDSPADTASLPAYDAWLRRILHHVDTMLPHCHALGLRVLLDLHTPPGGHDATGQWRLFATPAHQRYFEDLWKELTIRYRGNPAVWGFDLVNEPRDAPPSTDSVLDWPALATRVARVIRSHDPGRRIVVEAAPDGTGGALVGLQPLPVPGLTYSFHFYEPHAFTHQGVFGNAEGIRYPGFIDGQAWNAAQMRRALQRVRDWQQDHGVPVYVGEFSAARWAPDGSAYRYLRDCIALFELWGWSWAYHAFREASIWDAEGGGVRAIEERPPGGTDRLRLLKDWWRRNER